MSLSAAVLSFAVLAGLLTLVPGLDTALVLRAALTQGRRQAFATAVGIGSGSLVWGAAAAVGISALLTASHLAYDGVRLAGAAYMVWLGAGLLWSVRPTRPGPAAAAVPADDTPATAWRCWVRGLLTNLLNPKVGAFYVAVLPQFLPAHTSHLAVGLLLAAVHDVEGLLWFTVLILAARRARRWLASRAAQRAVDGVTGAVLVGFGLELGASAG